MSFNCVLGLPWWLGQKKSLPAMQKSWVGSLGWEDPPHSSILSCRIPWTEKPGGLQSMGLQGIVYN